MLARIGGSVINKYGSVILCYPSVAEQYVGYISYSLVILRCHKISSRPVNDLRRIKKIGHKHIQNIPKTCGRISHTMCKMQPAFLRSNGRGTQSILCFVNGVILLLIDDDLFFDFGTFNTIT